MSEKVKGTLGKERLCALFYRGIAAVLILLCTYVLYRSVFQINSLARTLSIYNGEMSPSDLNPVVLILGVCVYIAGMVQAYRLFSKEYFTDKRTMYVGIVLVALFFGGLMAFAHFVTINPTFDLSHIKRTVYAMTTRNEELSNEYYYKRYPNNLALLGVFWGVTCIGRFLGIQNISHIGNFLGSASIAVAALFAFLAVRRIRGNSTALLVLTIFMTNPLCYIYASYCYTDVVSMPFSMLIVYLLAVFWKSEKQRRDYLLLVAAGAAGGLGYKVRATVIFLLLAFVIWVVTKCRFKTAVKIIGMLLIGIAPVILGGKMLYVTNVVTEDKNLQFPISHWIMMGLNEEYSGRYNSMDFNQTNNYGTYEEKVAFNREEIASRIHEMGAAGLFRHAKEKLAVVWSDGYGLPSCFSLVEDYNGVYEYSIGSRNIFMRYYAQICRIAMFLFLLIKLACGIRKRDADISFLEITLLGAFAFYLLWEANERYSLCFLPWMLILMGQGFLAFDRKKETLFDARSKALLSRGAAAAVILASMFLIVQNRSKYTEEVRTYSEHAFVLSRGKIKTENILVGKKEIVQKFSSKKSFNRITLLTDENKGKRKTSYTAVLYEGDTPIRTVEFTNEQVKQNPNLVLCFDTVTPKEETVYKVVISSTNATKKNSIRLVSSYHCDEIEHKELKVNGKDLKRNLAISVSNYGERTYMGKGQYASLCLILLVAELLCFGSVFWNRKEIEYEYSLSEEG